MAKQETRSEELLYERVADHITQLIDQGTCTPASAFRQ
jgi:hypothetical protein